jgi:hypothetical protein
VRSLAFAPDGARLATAGYDGMVRVWHAGTGKPLWQQDCGGLLDLELQAPLVAFSPDGKTLAVSAYHSIRLWDAATGKELRSFRLPFMQLGGTLGFSADGQMLIATGDRGALGRWRPATSEQITALVLPGDTGSTIAVSPDGKLAAATGYHGWLTLWDLDAGRQLMALRKTEGTPYRLAFSPCGRYLAVCGADFGPSEQADDRAVEVVEVVSGKVLCSHRLPPRTGVSAAAFSADGRRLVTGMPDTTTLIWQLDAGGVPRGDAQLDELWAALAADDGKTAWRAMAALSAAPAETVAFLKQRVRPTQIDQQFVLRLVADLDSDRFSVREAASAQLKRFGPEVRVIYREVLAGNPPLEVRKRLELLQAVAPLPVTSAEVLRGLRAVAVLERIGSAEVREVLEALAQGAPEAWLTREAAAALQRLAR